METADRPGLLVDLVKIITDINVAVQSGEFDTEVVIPHSSPQVLIIIFLIGHRVTLFLFVCFAFWT